MDNLVRTEERTAHNAEAKDAEEEDFDLYEGIDAADHLIAGPASALPGASPSQAGDVLLTPACVPPDEERLVSFASLPEPGENEKEEDLVLLSGEIDLSLSAKAPRLSRTPAPSAGSPRIARVSSGLGRAYTFEAGNLGKRKKIPAGLSFTRIEVPLFLGPPPAIPELVPDAGGATTNSLLLLAQLSQWQTDISIREAAVQFGRVRAVRIFSNAFDGRSSGVGLLQFVSGEDAARAVSQGLDQALQAKQHGPRHVKVTVVPSSIVEELDACDSVSWTGGGPIPDQLLRKLFQLAGQAMPPRDRSALAASFFSALVSSHVELDGASATAVEGPRGGTASVGGLQKRGDAPTLANAGRSATTGPGRGSADPLGAARALYVCPETFRFMKRQFRWP
ncbi:putative RNA recognition motif, related protein [Toxoplasma gondii VAND]|uniref:Putative RNA recognition motif, related protein n=1 Tax=Toxoplasma gondii VAND TaxID=933077 RepID=A0A086Q236_TOXGO|nr:putative RNA recognition motif, related protein [Toxoplasma gondii VAND]